MTCYYYCLAYKDESTPSMAPSTITGSVIDLKPLPPTPSRRTETLHHHQYQQQRRTYRKATNKSTLNKTDEHCRSLFNLLPASFRSRHSHQPTSNSKGIDAVSMRNKQVIERDQAENWSLTSPSDFGEWSDSSFIDHRCTANTTSTSEFLHERERTNWLLSPSLSLLRLLCNTQF